MLAPQPRHVFERTDVERLLCVRFCTVQLVANHAEAQTNIRRVWKRDGPDGPRGHLFNPFSGMMSNGSAGKFFRDGSLSSLALPLDRARTIRKRRTERLGAVLENMLILSIVIGIRHTEWCRTKMEAGNLFGDEFTAMVAPFLDHAKIVHRGP